MRTFIISSITAIALLGGVAGCSGSADGTTRSVTGTVALDMKTLDNPVVIATSGDTRFVSWVNADGSFKVDVRTGDSYRLVLANSLSDGSYEIVSRIPWSDDSDPIRWARVEAGDDVELGTITAAAATSMSTRSHEGEGSESGDDRGSGRNGEAGDDRGNDGGTEAGDDHGSRSSEAGDDHGSRSSEAGDDHGSRSSEAGDDHGASSGNDSDSDRNDDKGGTRACGVSDDDAGDDHGGRRDRKNCEDRTIRTCSRDSKGERVRTRCIGHGRKVIVGVSRDSAAEREREDKVSGGGCKAGGGTAGTASGTPSTAPNGASCASNAACGSGACFAGVCGAPLAGALR